MTMTDTESRATVTIVGLGNIGSTLVGQVARNPRVAGIKPVDPDTYEPENIEGQSITPQDVGRFKAEVGARRAKTIRPDLEVEAICQAVEHVPMGRLRCKVMLGGLDSLYARQYAAEIAWRMGAFYLDAGITRPPSRIARLTVYPPGPTAPCLECSWGPQRYDSVETLHSCTGGRDLAPTAGPAALGAIVAGMQALELDKLLDGRQDESLAGKEWQLDTRTHRQTVSTLTRAPHCRFDHEIWDIEPLGRSSQTRLGELVDLFGHGASLALAGGFPFATLWTCDVCGHSTDVTRIYGRSELSACPQADCAGRLIPPGYRMERQLDLASAGDDELDRRLCDLGLLDMDVLTVTTAEGVRHLEIGKEKP